MELTEELRELSIFKMLMTFSPTYMSFLNFVLENSDCS